MISRGEIVTFYSYKGGTGRTMALANVAVLLARRQKKILMIDWDLDAPGLHRYFSNMLTQEIDEQDSYRQPVINKPGLIELFYDVKKMLDESPGWDKDEAIYKLFNQINIDSYILKTDISGLDLLAAGKFDKHYAARVNTFQWESLFNQASWFFRQFSEYLATRYQYVLIDSRTGYSDISGICTSLMPEKLVTVFTPNRQSLLGIKDIITDALEYRRYSDDLRPLVVFPLPSRVEAAEPELRKKWRHDLSGGEMIGYQKLFEDLFKHNYDLDKSGLQAYFDDVQIQHVPRYSYGEEIAVLEEAPGDRLSIADSYEFFTNKLQQATPWLEAVIGYEDEAVGELVKISRKTNVFLSYAEEDSAIALRLAKELLQAGFGVSYWQDAGQRGKQFILTIEKEIYETNFYIALMSPHFLDSSWCAQERNMALRREDELKNHFIRVVQVEPVNPTAQVNIMLEYNWIDISGEKAEKGIEKLIASIASIEKREETLELPFTNREYELSSVLSATAPAYHIFDAPAGYGKTVLLRRIEERFEEYKWLTSFLSINERQAKRDIVLQLAKRFGLDISQLDGDKYGNKFGDLLFEKWRYSPENNKKGVVFLFDLEGMPSDNFEYIVNSLIPETKDILSENKFFSQNHNAFRVIFTGRYLSRCETVSKSKIEFKIAKLAPFSYDVIKETILKHELFKDTNDSSLSKLAADLVFITGGHPGCISKIVELYEAKGGSIKKFVETNDRYIWNNIVKPFVEEMRTGIPVNLRGKLDTLSVLRRFDIPLLVSMMKKYWLLDFGESSVSTDDLNDQLLEDKTLELEKELLGTRLIDRNSSERILEDGTTRHLLLINLRHELSGSEFQMRCRDAQKFFWERIEDISLQGPEKWFVEYLFQELQQHAPFISNSSYRKAQRDIFFDDTLPNAVRMFIDERGEDKWRDDKLALLDWIDDDWEFCFTVNYYLRGNQFTEYPCRRLRDMINGFAG